MACLVKKKKRNEKIINSNSEHTLHTRLDPNIFKFLKYLGECTNAVCCSKDWLSILTNHFLIFSTETSGFFIISCARGHGSQWWRVCPCGLEGLALSVASLLTLGKFLGHSALQVPSLWLEILLNFASSVVHVLEKDTQKCWEQFLVCNGLSNIGCLCYFSLSPSISPRCSIL